MPLKKAEEITRGFSFNGKVQKRILCLLSAFNSKESTIGMNSLDREHKSGCLGFMNHQTYSNGAVPGLAGGLDLKI